MGTFNFIVETLKTATTTYQNSVLSTQSLKDQLELRYSLDQNEQNYNVMNFGYTGINGQGSMISDRDINTIIVNTSSIPRDQYTTIKYLIEQGYITFYSNNVEFNWNQVQDSNGNWLIIN